MWKFHTWNLNVEFHIWNIWYMKSLCGIETISYMKISYMKYLIYEIFMWNWNNFIYENFIYEIFDIWNLYVELKQFHIWKFHIWNISYIISLCGIETISYMKISYMKISYMKYFIYEIFIWNWNNFIYENFIYEIFHIWNISYMKFVSIPYNKIANIVTNATNTPLSHPAHSIILFYHPESGWHVTSRNQGLPSPRAVLRKTLGTRLITLESFYVICCSYGMITLGIISEQSNRRCGGLFGQIIQVYKKQ